MSSANDGSYPVPGRSPEQNRRIATHENGHALLARCLGSNVRLVTIVPGHGYAGRCIRSGPPSNIDFDDRSPEGQTNEILSVCERLERMAPELGSSRVADSEVYIRAQIAVIELVGGQIAENILFPDLPSLGANHDFVEAKAFAGVACAASPAVEAMIIYAESEARALLSANIDILRDLVAALIDRGTLWAPKSTK
jgi:hypothetical protein